MAGETIITITGNLTRDPELRTTANGGTVANITIAASERRFNRDTNQWEDGGTLFLNCSAWDRPNAPIAQNIAATLSKGMSVIAQGALRQRAYQAKDGTQRTVMDLQIHDIGPSLRKATAMVKRQQYSTGSGFGSGQQTGFGSTASPTSTRQADKAPASDPFAGQDDTDPWGSPDENPEF